VKLICQIAVGMLLRDMFEVDNWFGMWSRNVKAEVATNENEEGMRLNLRLATMMKKQPWDMKKHPWDRKTAPSKDSLLG
jgi:hypothetical protein